MSPRQDSKLSLSESNVHACSMIPSILKISGQETEETKLLILEFKVPYSLVSAYFTQFIPTS